MLPRTVMYQTLTLGLALSLSSFADIKQVATMAEALAPVDADTLLIFDLDNTIIETTQTLGSDQWFEHYLHQQISKRLKDGLPEAKATSEGLLRALTDWKSIQRVTSVQLVEQVTADLIAKHQKTIKVMGLTARPIDLADATYKQLNSVGVDLTKSAAFPNDLILNQGGGDVNFIAKFQKGILFSGNSAKGPMLLKFLALANVSAKKIIFVDDKQKNVDSVDKALDTLPGITHTSMRYGAADKKVDNFDSKIADVQFSFFGKILTDQAAQTLVDAE